MMAIMAIVDVLAITWCNLRDWARAGCGDLGWVQVPHPELHRTYPRRFRTSVNNPAQINYAPAARPIASSIPGPSSCPPSSNHRKRRVCSGSRPIPTSGGDAHSFMTLGLCTRNEKCAPAPLPNRALPRCCLWVACGSVSGGKPCRGQFARNRGLACHRLKTADPGRELVSDFPPRSCTVNAFP